MKRPYIASMVLTAALLFATGGALATFRHGRTADPSAHPARVCGLNNSAPSVSQPSARKQAGDKVNGRLTAQVQVATVCYTYAGPVCPMFVAVPVGAPCVCETVYGPLPGIAD
jgi:hypothetical protein